MYKQSMSLLRRSIGFIKETHHRCLFFYSPNNRSLQLLVRSVYISYIPPIYHLVYNISVFSIKKVPSQILKWQWMRSVWPSEIPSFERSNRQNGKAKVSYWMWGSRSSTLLRGTIFPGRVPVICVTW